MLYSPDESLMSSLGAFLNPNTLSILLHLLVIFLAALLVNRLLLAGSKLMIRTATGKSRAEQAREEQTRALASLANGVASKVVWVLAVLTALDRLGVNPVPALVLAGLFGVAAGFGAQNLVRDVIGGIFIVWEDQYAVGDTVRTGEFTGRVEQLTLRRTVIRDARGALVTIGNGEIRSVANLSRDWSQAFVDVTLAPETPLERGLAALESAAAELRGDGAWSQALLDGPRVLGVEGLDRNGSVLRLQMKTLPTRQEEISRELRRRIQLELQRRGVPMSGVLRIELSNVTAPEGAPLAPDRH